MKKNLYKLVFTCLSFVGIGNAFAQTTIYDANRWMGSDLNGTARFIGMGGAMSALGGDISTMGTNPAGIGIYRSNDAMISFGFTNTGAKDAGGASVDKFHGSFDNAGFVLSSKIGSATTLRYVNFGFNYHRNKSFNKNMVMNGLFGASQTEQMTRMLNFEGVDNFAPWEEGILQAKNAYENADLPWLGLLGYNAYLSNPVYVRESEDSEEEVFDGYESYYQNGDEVRQAYTARERGGIHAYDFNVAFNLNDRFYLGATIGAYSIDYSRTSLYKEDFTDVQGLGQGGYDLGNEYWADGSGVDFKLGFIWRPIETSSFRIGAAVHTPTFYSITERNRAYIDHDIVLDNEHKKGRTEPMDKYDNPMDGEYKYHLTTPWKFNVSTGYTIGTVAALGLEYEYMNYSSAKLKDPDGMELEQTSDINSMMKGVHTLRLGAEFKLAPEFAFRVGYNHITASMKSDAFKWLQDNSIRTDTEYSNRGATNNYTLGFGYRGELFYADMAYMYSAYSEDFYAFDSVNLSGTKIDNNNHKVVFTLGMRF